MKLQLRTYIVACLVLASISAFARGDADNNALVSQIVKLLSDPDREFRAAGLDAIRTSAKGAEQTKTFAAELPKLSADAQVALIVALADRGDSVARPAILEQLASKEESVRATVLTALGEIGGASEIPVLIKALGAGSNSEQQSARNALIRMRDATVAKTIASESKTATPQVRSKMIDVLAGRRAMSEVPVIVAATTDKEGGVRNTAMNALGLIGQPDQLAAMLPGVLMATRGGERDNAERNVVEVCRRIANENERGDALIAALGTVGTEQRDELMSLVGRVGGKRLIKFVADIATGSDAARRSFGIDALSKWPDSSPADTLLEIAKSTTDAGERRQTFAAFVKVCASRDSRNDRQRLERMKQAMKEARNAEEKSAVINRTRTAYDVESMRFVRSYLDEPEFAQIACETIVELAHHRQVRDPHKEEFDAVLDKVIKLAKNDEWIERANHYKRGETWERKK